MSTIRATERTAVLGRIDPDAYGAGAVNTDVIDMQNWGRVVFDVLVGDFVSTGKADFVVKGDSASGGSFATTVTGKVITQLTEAGTDSNKIVRVEVTDVEAKAQGFRYLRGTLTLTTAGADAAVIVTGHDPRFAPASGHDIAAVDEIVA